MSESPEVVQPRATDRYSSWTRRLLEEVGLVTLYQSSLDTKILCFQRFVRVFAYGGCTLILAAYLSALGNGEDRIGLFMTLTLIGDTGISLFLTLFADALGRRIILGAGSLLMVASGIIFALSSNYYVLLIAAILGVISPSGHEVGPFRAIEESTLAHLTPAEMRGDVFAWYSLFGFAGGATGILVWGWSISALQTRGYSELGAYHFSFFVYAAMGLLKFVLACGLSRKSEMEQTPAALSAEAAPLLPDGSADDSSKKPKWKSMLPSISHESVSILVKLCILFAMDSFASGLAPLAWITYFFKTKFHLKGGDLGSIFFTSQIIAASSQILASSIAKRIGNIKTMVFTHLPSAIALALIPFPSQLSFALVFLMLRACTQSMDTVPRSAFLSAIVLPSERTAVMGAVNVVKTTALSLSPSITGVLAHSGYFWIAFVASGGLKATYDILLLIVFLGHRPREEREAERQRQVQSEQRDEDGDEEPPPYTA